LEEDGFKWLGGFENESFLRTFNKLFSSKQRQSREKMNNRPVVNPIIQRVNRLLGVNLSKIIWSKQFQIKFDKDRRGNLINPWTLPFSGAAPKRKKITLSWD
jgi:hypothetical protein